MEIAKGWACRAGGAAESPGESGTREHIGRRTLDEARLDCGDCGLFSHVTTAFIVTFGAKRCVSLTFSYSTPHDGASWRKRCVKLILSHWGSQRAQSPLDACLPARQPASPRTPMAQRPRSEEERSTEAPMDFQFTSRPSVDFVPVWKAPATPLKRE